MMRGRAMIAMVKTAKKMPIPAVDLGVKCRPIQLAQQAGRNNRDKAPDHIVKMLYSPWLRSI
jgi:hypothetical protein